VKGLDYKKGLIVYTFNFIYQDSVLRHFVNLVSCKYLGWNLGF